MGTLGHIFAGWTRKCPLNAGTAERRRKMLSTRFSNVRWFPANVRETHSDDIVGVMLKDEDSWEAVAAHVESVLLRKREMMDVLQ